MSAHMQRAIAEALLNHEQDRIGIAELGLCSYEQVRTIERGLKALEAAA